MLENRKKLQNDFARKKLYKNILEYSKVILKELEENKNILPIVLSSLEITEEDFLKFISLENKNNIVFYDQVLCLINKNKKL